MNKRRYTLTKSERLREKALKDRLFKQKNQFFTVYPLRLLVIYGMKLEEETLIPILMIVSKKRIRRAVSRNTVKRRLREAYRLEKYQLYDYHLQNKILALGVIYLATHVLSFKVIKMSLNKLLEKVIHNDSK